MKNFLILFLIKKIRIKNYLIKLIIFICIIKIYRLKIKKIFIYLFKHYYNSNIKKFNKIISLLLIQKKIINKK